MDVKETPLKALTPEQVADILQIKKNTVYQLINRGEIIAKKIGSQYRIPLSSLSFVTTGLDDDLLKAEQIDLASLPQANQILKQVRNEQ